VGRFATVAIAGGGLHLGTIKLTTAVGETHRDAETVPSPRHGKGRRRRRRALAERPCATQDAKQERVCNPESGLTIASLRSAWVDSREHFIAQYPSLLLTLVECGEGLAANCLTTGQAYYGVIASALTLCGERWCLDQAHIG
jgi:hypothetical protein